jgi:hypothetical protein
MIRVVPSCRNALSVEKAAARKNQRKCGCNLALAAETLLVRAGRALELVTSRSVGL